MENYTEAGKRKGVGKPRGKGGKGRGQEFPVRILTCVSLGILHVSFHLLLTRLPWRKKVLTF